MSAPTPRDLAAHWLAIAEGDLATAEAVLGNPRLPSRQVAVLAQQAAEKAIKGVLVLAGREPPRSHDLTELIHLVPMDWRLRAAGIDLAPLTTAMRPARYPDYFDPPLTRGAVVQLVSDARAVIEAARGDLADRGQEQPPAV